MSSATQLIRARQPRQHPKNISGRTRCRPTKRHSNGAAAPLRPPRLPPHLTASSPGCCRAPPRAPPAAAAGCRAGILVCMHEAVGAFKGKGTVCSQAVLGQYTAVAAASLPPSKSRCPPAAPSAGPCATWHVPRALSPHPPAKREQRRIGNRQLGSMHAGTPGCNT